MGRGFEGLDGHNGYAALASTASLAHYDHGGPTDHGESIEMKYGGGEGLLTCARVRRRNSVQNKHSRHL